MVEDDSKRVTDKNDPRYRSPWGHIIRGMWRSPLGLMGVTLTTVSATLLVIGVALDMMGAFDNPYFGVFTYMVLPGGMITGLALIPLAAYLRRRKYYTYGISRDHLKINLSDHVHRRWIIGFIVLTVINVCILSVVGYEGYHFTDSPYFCGKVCHQVMEPEYTAYMRSSHAKVVCVECHIGPGADWFVRAKLSGLRQVVAVLTDSYTRPIPAPVEHLRPNRDTCEECHWPEKFHGKKIKAFTRFSNDDQKNPEVTEVALHIGGRNARTDAFEGIHWHVSKDVEVKFLAADKKRSQIAKVRVKNPDGTEKEFVKSDIELPEEGGPEEWRVMECVDCHNRPTHVYQMPEERVDFGLLSGAMNSDIVGIREDGLKVLHKEYESRDQAKEQLVDYLLELQTARDAEQAKKYEADIRKAGAYLLETYLGNVWPKMNVTWGTYQSHLGHQYADDGYGCWRCHDEEHVSETGETISQDCSLCHDEPS